MANHVVVGSGPLGSSVAAGLVSEGETVRLVSRNPAPLPEVETRKADATDAAAMARAVEGAGVVYNCANAPYHRWLRELPPIWRGIHRAARAAEARLVVATNLYAYGVPKHPFTSESPFAPRSAKGRVRALLEMELLEADRKGELPVAIVRASDFFGPGVMVSQIGDRFFPPLLAGRAAGMVGRLDVPHSFAFLPDFARAMIEVARDPDAYGQTWIAPHAPPVTAHQLGRIVTKMLEERGTDAATPAVKSVTKAMLRLAGLFNPGARALIEMYYQFDRPFTVDSSETRTRFGLAATPLGESIHRTLAWFAEAALTGSVAAA